MRDAAFIMGGLEFSAEDPPDPRHVRAHTALERENTRLRDLVVRYQRSSSMGALSLGLLHDMVNTLTSVLGLNDLTRNATTEERAPLRDAIHDQTWRATDLARELLRLGHGTASLLSPVRPLDFDTHVGRLGKVYSHLLAGSNIQFKLRCKAHDTFVVVDPIEVGRVIGNLVSNARDAIGVSARTGQISVTTARVEVQADRAARLGLSPGPFLQLNVVDTGRGMTDRELGQVLKPFFTTKSTTGGTGLGLAVVHDIVRKARGAVDVHSELGRGTEIAILLPACSDPVRRDPEPAPGDAPTPLRVLVLEDDPRRRASLTATLQSRGHHVDALGASLLDELGWQLSNLERWDVLIQDGSMPLEHPRTLMSAERGVDGAWTLLDLSDILGQFERPQWKS